MYDFNADLAFLKSLLLELDLQAPEILSEVDPVTNISNGLTGIQANLETRGSQLDGIMDILSGVLG